MDSTTITIQYKGVFDHCARLSAFEGKNAISPTGDSNYEEVLITPQDESLIKDYTLQASGKLEEMLGRMIYSSEEDEEGENILITVAPLDNKRINRTLLESHSKEAIAAYVMYMWLTDRKPQRMEFYQKLFLEMCRSCQSAVYTKRKPTLEDFDDTDNA